MRLPIKQDHQNGETRRIRRFALWPTKIGTWWVWFEFYTIHQVYRSYRYDDYSWVNEWQDLLTTVGT